MIPNGYVLYEETDDYIVVTVNFSEVLNDAPDIIEHKSKFYKREMIQAIPNGLQNTVYSMRKYVV